MSNALPYLIKCQFLALVRDKKPTDCEDFVYQWFADEKNRDINNMLSMYLKKNMKFLQINYDTKSNRIHIYLK